MYKDNKVVVVMPTYNEEAAIGDAVENFKKNEFVDEIIVVDNNSSDRSSEIAKKLGCVVIAEHKQGYGNAIIRGLKESLNRDADLIFIVEPDLTFSAYDMPKFFAYVDDGDMIVGTRTCMQMVEEGAKMDMFLRFGNIFVAKLLEIKFKGNVHLTDVGCTYRLIKRSVVENLIDRLVVGTSEFSPHMILEVLKLGYTVIEIPIKYRVRKGESKITYNWQKSFILGLKMIKGILLKF